MSSVDFGRYKRMVRYFWDPQPKNNDGINVPIWCLGKRYDSTPWGKPNRITSFPAVHDKKREIDSASDEDKSPQTFRRSSVETGGDEGYLQAQGHSDEDDRGWPKDFLDDFESRIWFTYRSSFPVIKKSTNSKSSNSIALSTLLRSQIADQGGFTSDTGWGCMIRSGQSLLANALIMLRLGRGTKA